MFLAKIINVLHRESSVTYGNVDDYMDYRFPMMYWIKTFETVQIVYN